jgi:N6-L-threonylcarbamoyladenine synthase
MKGSKEPHFSFAGLKSAVLRAVESGEHKPADISASFQQAAIDCLIDRLEHAVARSGSLPSLVVAGGVAANKAIRAALENFATSHAMCFSAPPLALCTDNAAMIAWAGCERLPLSESTPLDFKAKPRWPLDSEAEAVRGAGVKA